MRAAVVEAFGPGVVGIRFGCHEFARGPVQQIVKRIAIRQRHQLPRLAADHTVKQHGHVGRVVVV